jgi:paraquat-inducible protein B
MTDNGSEPTAGGTPPLAVKKTPRERGFSPIWIIPIVALLIGLLLIYRVISETGPTITVSFNSASGIEAGKTKVKFKDVEVGEVTKVDIQPDLKSVEITVSMSSSARQYMTDKTRFWVVRPQISGGSISGLGTLLSGNYIGIDPSSEGRKTNAFIGLERPPVIRSDEAGSNFKLVTKELGGLNFGSLVYFREIAVGSVVQYQSLDNGDIELEIFVREPYDKHVNQATRFWNAGGFDITLDANGLEIKTQSLVTIIAGGIAFDTFSGMSADDSKPVAQGHTFHLYPSRTASMKKTYTEKRKIMFYFDDPVNGLLPGAPVQLRGYTIGQVLDVSLEFNRETGSFRIPVLAEFQPQRIKIIGQADFEQTMEQMVESGIRAQLASGNLLLGRLLISLDLHPEEPPAQVDTSGPYPVIPTIRGTFGEIAHKARILVDELRQTAATINRFLGSEAFRESVGDLTATLAHLKQISAEFDEKTAPQITAVLSTVESTLAEARGMLASDSTTRTEINRVLIELGEAASSIRQLADYLEQHPEAFIRGKE